MLENLLWPFCKLFTKNNNFTLRYSVYLITFVKIQRQEYLAEYLVKLQLGLVMIDEIIALFTEKQFIFTFNLNVNLITL